MMIALDNSQNGVAKFFLDHGANPKVWDIYGRTALYVAIDHAPGAGSGRRWRRCLRCARSASPTGRSLK